MLVSSLHCMLGPDYKNYLSKGISSILMDICAVHMLYSHGTTSLISLTLLQGAAALHTQSAAACTGA